MSSYLIYIYVYIFFFFLLSRLNLNEVLTKNKNLYYLFQGTVATFYFFFAS